jgi:hypothetical protein
VISPAASAARVAGNTVTSRSAVTARLSMVRGETRNAQASSVSTDRSSHSGSRGQHRDRRVRDDGVQQHLLRGGQRGLVPLPRDEQLQALFVLEREAFAEPRRAAVRCYRRGLTVSGRNPLWNRGFHQHCS